MLNQQQPREQILLSKKRVKRQSLIIHAQPDFFRTIQWGLCIFFIQSNQVDTRNETKKTNLKRKIKMKRLMKTREPAWKSTSNQHFARIFWFLKILRQEGFAICTKRNLLLGTWKVELKYPVKLGI